MAGTILYGTNGTLILGSNEVIPEATGDPVNAIPRFLGHPAGGPVYTNTRPAPRMEAMPPRRPAGAEAGVPARSKTATAS